jgi:hypothetical protein
MIIMASAQDRRSTEVLRPGMPLEPELMRSCLLEAMRRDPQTQFENLKYATAEVANERGLYSDATPNAQPRIDRSDFRRLREAIWALIAEGVIVVGSDSGESWPWVSLTEYGERYVKDQRANPHDRSEYLKRVRAVAEVDEVEGRYVLQALDAYAHNLPDAAAVMIGAASEHLLILTLSDVASNDATASAAIQGALAGPALAMHRLAREYFLERRAKLPRDLAETLETTFLGIASVIRVARNDAGHPALPSVDRERCFVLLQLYPDYRAWLFRARTLLPL